MSLNYSDSYVNGQKMLNDAKKIVSGASGIAGPIGENLGNLINNSMQVLFDDSTRHSRFKEGVWYRLDPLSGEYYDVTQQVTGKKSIAPGSKFVAEPWRKVSPVGLRAANRDIISTINNNPVFAATTAPLLPINDHIDEKIEKGFDHHNFDPRPPLLPIFDDGRDHTSQPHPSSRYSGNSAIPFTTQGFRR